MAVAGYRGESNFMLREFIYWFGGVRRLRRWEVGNLAAIRPHYQGFCHSVEPTRIFLRSISAVSASILLETACMNQGLCTTYMESLEPEKLLQLRAKTDRQLLDFIHSKLEVGLNFAALAESLYSEGNRVPAEQSLERGEQALNEVQLLLPVVTEKQKRGLEPKLSILRETLKRLSGLRESPKTRTATGSC